MHDENTSVFSWRTPWVAFFVPASSYLHFNLILSEAFEFILCLSSSTVCIWSDSVRSSQNRCDSRPNHWHLSSTIDWILIAAPNNVYGDEICTVTYLSHTNHNSSHFVILSEAFEFLFCLSSSIVWMWNDLPFSSHGTSTPGACRVCALWSYFIWICHIPITRGCSLWYLVRHLNSSFVCLPLPFGCELIFLHHRAVYATFGLIPEAGLSNDKAQQRRQGDTYKVFRAPFLRCRCSDSYN